MRVLIAEDEPVARRVAQKAVEGFGHEVEIVEDGLAAWRRLQAAPFDVLISDWLMPGLDGLELCRRVRARGNRPYCYVILLTARRAKEDLVAGIMAGADDFVSKPFDHAVLRARLHTAERVTRLERDLEGKVGELQRALEEVKTLRGLLPICMYCKRIHESQDVWRRIESYVSEHSEAAFTHSICPDCYEKEVKPQLDELRGRGRPERDA